jgi:WD40 repeat protein
VLSVAVSPDGAWVVSGSKDRRVQFWNPVDAQTQLMLQGHKNSGTTAHTLSPVHAGTRLYPQSSLFSHLDRSESRGWNAGYRERGLASTRVYVYIVLGPPYSHSSPVATLMSRELHDDKSVLNW